MEDDVRFNLELNLEALRRSFVCLLYRASCPSFILQRRLDAPFIISYLPPQSVLLDSIERSIIEAKRSELPRQSQRAVLKSSTLFARARWGGWGGREFISNKRSEILIKKFLSAFRSNGRAFINNNSAGSRNRFSRRSMRPLRDTSGDLKESG